MLLLLICIKTGHITLYTDIVQGKMHNWGTCGAPPCSYWYSRVWGSSRETLWKIEICSHQKLGITTASPIKSLGKWYLMHVTTPSDRWNWEQHSSNFWIRNVHDIARCLDLTRITILKGFYKVGWQRDSCSQNVASNVLLNFAWQ